MTPAVLNGIIRINSTPGDSVPRGKSDFQLKYWLHTGEAIQVSFCKHNISERILKIQTNYQSAPNRLP